MMTLEEFQELVARGHEVISVEFKGPHPRTDGHFFAQVVRAVLGLANERDGGKVIVGVEERAGVLIPTGLSPKHLATWQHDAVAEALSQYADPYVSFESETFEYLGASYKILNVGPFEDIPVLCKKEYVRQVRSPNGNVTHDVILRKGACYVRRRGRPSTSDIPTQAEMRELIDLATDRKLRKYVEQSFKAGLAPCPFVAGANVPELSRDEELYGEQLGNL